MILPIEKKSAAAGLAGRDLLRISDLTVEEIECIFEVASVLKNRIVPIEEQKSILNGTALAMIFEKQSLRTRVSFETGIYELGGHGIYLAPNDISLGKRESVADVSKTLDRMCGMIMARVFEHDKVVGLAANAKHPVINGLSDLEHPCQALADLLTVKEKKGNLKGLKMAFIGDGNNVAHSLMLICAKIGMDFAIACPKGYEPFKSVVDETVKFAEESGSRFEIKNNAKDTAENADVIYTDVWASMGQESEAKEREIAFAEFQVNSELMAKAKSDAIFEHCLPAHRGSEVTDEVVDSLQSVVFDEAENRLHTAKAIMSLTM